jgi:hypothetical protein
MPYGTHIQRHRIGLWKSATSASYAWANSTVFSISYVQQTSNPGLDCQSTMSDLSPSHQTISPRVFFLVAITVQPESAWIIDRASTHLGNCDLQSNVSSLTISVVRMTFRRSHSNIAGNGKAQCYSSQLTLDVKTLFHRAILASGW